MLALIIGMIAAAVVGYLVGLIALRRTGIYFAMITVAIAEMFYLRRVQSAVGLDRRRERPARRADADASISASPPSSSTPAGRSIAFLAFCYFIGIVIALRIVRSPVGAILSAIRDNPLRAAAVGHNIHGYKLTAFVIAAAYAGFAGGLLGVLQGFMPPDAFTFDTSGQLVMQTAIGGAGTLFGPLVGAAVWLFLQDFLQATLGLGATWKLVLGVVFVLLVCFLRRGIIGGLARSLRRSSPRKRRAKPAEPDDAAPAIDAPATRSGARAAPVADAPRHRARRLSGPILQAQRPDQALRRPRRQQRHRFHGAAAASCAASSARTAPARATFFKMLTCEVPPTSGTHHVRGPRHHRHERHRRLPARPDQELPGQPALHPPDGAREPDDRRAGRAARQVPARPAAQRCDSVAGLQRAGRAHARAGAT